MFKWTKRRPSGEPSTPKLGSISLPDETPARSVSTTQWTTNFIRQPTSTFSRSVPDHRSKTRHASAAPPTSQLSEKTPRTRTSSTIKRVDSRMAAKARGDDIEVGYVSSPDGYTRERKASSRVQVPIKGILKPPKPFIEPDFNKPVIPVPPHASEGRSYGFDKAGSTGFDSADMRGSEKPYRSANEKTADNTSQNAAQSRYRPLQPPILPPGAPSLVPGYMGHGPVMPMNGPYYAAAPTSRVPPGGSFGAPQGLPQVPLQYIRSSRYGSERGGGSSDTEGLPRGPRPSRREGGLSDTEEMSRTRSSRYGAVAPQDPQTALHRVPSQQSRTYRHEQSGRNRAATYPMDPENNRALSRSQGAEDYSRSRNQSFSGYAAPEVSRGPASSSYVRPHIQVFKGAFSR